MHYKDIEAVNEGVATLIDIMQAAIVAHQKRVSDMTKLVNLLGIVGGAEAMPDKEPQVAEMPGKLLSMRDILSRVGAGLDPENSNVAATK